MDTNDDLNGSKNRKNNNIHTLSKTTEYLKKTKKWSPNFFYNRNDTIPRQSVPDLLNEGRGKKVCKKRKKLRNFSSSSSFF